jgi:amino acid adenylation domain-containing protein
MLGHFERMLLAGAREPETVLSALPMLDDAERATVLANARGPELDYQRRPVHHLVAEQAARTPDAVAVRSGDREVTYAQLSTMAGALSATLSGRGVGKGEIVASLFERGIDEIVAILGILGAGGVYAPLDPAAPPGRLASIVARAGISRVVSHSDQLSLVPEGADLLLTDRDLTDRDLTGRDLTGRDPLAARGGGWDAGVDADSVAYALHTSGSTGVPKATLLTHGALANYLAWMTRDWSLGPGDRVLHVCAPVFDLAAAEILASLTTGASVVVASRDVLLSPGTLAELLAAERVTHLFVTPTVLSLVEPAPFPDLREVMVGGELCPPDLPSRWARPGRHVRNLYGPTETTIGCTVFDATGWAGPGVPPIGRPMPNRSVYVLEPSGEPAPVGVPGEMVVGGTGVGLGYLNDPERTAAAFVPDPFQPPGQLYRTGDLAFWTSDAQLQFVGRRDTQVKLRGLRIELGEIESALARHPGVAAVAVAVRLDDAGVQQLVAYLVAAAGAEPPAPADLRSFLAAALPASMVPGWYQFLDKLPMTATDKVDRKALPPLTRTGEPSGERPLVAPRTDAERHVVDAFAAVLGLERVSVEDSFFDLGGHSLQAAYVLARLARTTGVSVALKAFYAEPGVAAVARLLSSAGGLPSARSTLVTIKEAGSLPRVFCPHAVSGSPYWYVGLSRALHRNRPMDSFEAPGMEGEEPPIEDLRTLAARYVAELRRRQPAGPYLLAGWSMGGFLAFEMGRQLVAAGEAPTRVVMIDSNAPGPLPRPSEYDIMQTFVNDMAGVAGLAPVVLDPAVPSLEPGERVARLRETLVSSGLVPPDIAEEFITNRFAVFRANVLAIYAYQPETYPGEVVMFQAAEEESRAPWSAYAGGGYTEVVLPGTHYSMWSPANLPRLAEALEHHLTAAVSPTGTEQ